ncbi:hypothetical protein [Rhodovulum sp. 12E13]|uniref:hypothetical protein n=1 Tax=Rhodovulum sp. 12E13 TaxID=2203891 RepID=UPI0011C048DE|nr:hypothetical protein [Rhodovulum sp. 12E13]
MNPIRETFAGCRTARPLAAILALAVTGAVAQPVRDAPPCAGRGDLLCGDTGAPVEDSDATADPDQVQGDGAGTPRPVTRAETPAETTAETPAGAIAGADDGPTGDVVPRRRPTVTDSPAVEAERLRPRRRADPEPKGGSQRPRPRVDALDVPEPERQAAPARPRAPSPGRDGE